MPYEEENHFSSDVPDLDGRIGRLFTLPRPQEARPQRGEACDKAAHDHHGFFAEAGMRVSLMGEMKRRRPAAR